LTPLTPCFRGPWGQEYGLVSVFDKNTRGFCLTMSYGSRNVVMTKGVVSGGEFDLRLRRITSSPSQTIRLRLVRRTATNAAVSARLDACRRLRHYFSHFATYGLQYCRPVCSVCNDIRSESRFFDTPPAFDAPVRVGSGRNIAILFGMEKLEWLGYPIWF